MSKLKAEDFKDLNVGPFAKKLNEVTDLEFLSELEQNEKIGKNRVTVIEAINIRQGVVLDLATPAKGEDGVEVTNEEIDLSDDEQHDSSGEKGDEGENGIPAPPIGDGMLSEKPITEGPTGTPGTPGPKGIQYESEEEVLQKEDEVEKDGGALREESNVEKIRRVRLELDRILQYSEGHFRIDEGVNKSIFRSKAWLGKMLHFEGADNPYEVGKIKDAKEIPATAEKNEGTEFTIARRNFGMKNVLDAIQELRGDMHQVSEDIKGISTVNDESNACCVQAWVNICEAKFELGAQLSKMRIK